MPAPRLVSCVATLVSATVGVALLTVLAPTSTAATSIPAASSATSSAVSPARAAVATSVTHAVCATKKTGAVTVPSSARCGSGKRKVTLSVARATRFCLASRGRAFVIGAKKLPSAKRCKARKGSFKGRVVKAPTAKTLTFCVRGRTTRWVAASKRCPAGSRRVQARNVAPTKPRLAPAEVAATAPAGTRIGALSATDPNPGERLTFSLAPGGTHNAYVRLTGSTLLTARSLAPVKSGPLRIAVQVRDRQGLRATATLTIALTTPTVPNRAPLDLALSSTSVAEEMPVGTPVGTVSVTDPDAGDVHTISVPHGDFTVVGSELRTARVLSAADPRPVAEITATDRGGLTLTRTVDITVLARPDKVLLDTSSVPEFSAVGTTVGTVSVEDPGGVGPWTYALTGGADAADFTLEGTTLRTARAIAQRDGTQRALKITVTSANGTSRTSDLVVQVTRTPTAPTNITLAPATVGADLPSGTVVGALAAVDPNTDETATFTLVSGTGATHNAQFAISGGSLRTAQVLDRANPLTRSIRVRVTDADAKTYEQVLTVRVVAGNRAPGQPALSGAVVAENKPAATPVGTVSATDPDGDALTYSLSGPDAADFALTGTSLATARPLDHEAKATRSLTLTATDPEGLSSARTVTVSVTDVNEAPTVVVSTVHVTEDQPAATLAGSFTVTDPEGDATSATITGADLVVSGTTLRTSRVFDFESTPVVTATLTVTDPGGLTGTAQVTVSVADVNETPVAVNDTYTGLVGNVTATLGATPPGTGAAQALTGSLPLANDTDPDGDTLSVVVAGGAGTRSSARGGTVTLSTNGMFRYQPPTGLRAVNDTFTYQLTDGALTTTGTVTLTVSDRRIWFVAPGGAGAGSGTQVAPFTSVTSVLGANDPDTPGDEIFLAPGTHALPSAGLVLEQSQHVYGGAEGVTIGDKALIAPASASTLSSTGTGLVLANGTAVRALRVTAPTTLVAAGVNTASVATTVTLISGTEGAIQVSGGSGNLDLRATVVAGVGGEGVAAVRIANRTGTTTLGPITSSTTSSGVELVSAGTVTLTAPLTLNTTTRPGLVALSTVLTDSVGGHRITTTTGTPVSLNAGSLTAPLTFTRIVSNGAQRGIDVIGTSGSPVVVRSTEAAPSTITGSTDVGIRFANAAAPSLTWVTVTGGGGDGIQVSNTPGALTLKNSTVSANAEDQVQLSYSGATAGSAVITDNTFSGGQSGLLLTRDGSAWAGALTFDVRRNTVTGSSGTALLVGATGMPASGGMSGFIGENTIGAATPGSCSSTGNGIEVTNEAGAGALAVALTQNVVKNCAQRGISLMAGDGNAGLQATVTGNQVSGSLDSPNGYALDLTVGTTPTDAGTSCLDVSGNTVTSAPGLTGLRLRSRWGTTRLPGSAGSLGTPSAVVAYLAGRNTGTATVTGQGFATGTCSQPIS